MAAMPPLCSASATRAITAACGTIASVVRRRMGPASGTSSESDLHIDVWRDVDAVDEPDAMRLVLHDDRAGPHAVSEESHAAHERAVGDTGGGEDDARPGGEILRSIDPLEVGNAHGAAPVFVLRLVDHQSREDLAIQAAHRRGGQHALWRPARAHDGMDAAADDGCRNPGREIAVANEPDSRAGGADVVDELLVSGPIEHDDH